MVQPYDSDAETYSHINEHIASSERRTRDANVWRSQINDPTLPDHPGYQRCTGGTADFVKRMNDVLPAFNELCRRQDLAVATTRKRLGLLADDLDRVFEPWDTPPPEPLE